MRRIKTIDFVSINYKLPDCTRGFMGENRYSAGVLVVNDKGYYFVAVYDSRENIFICNGTQEIINVTHWVELPYGKPIPDFESKNEGEYYSQIL